MSPSSCSATQPSTPTTMAELRSPVRQSVARQAQDVSRDEGYESGSNHSASSDDTSNGSDDEWDPSSDSEDSLSNYVFDEGYKSASNQSDDSNSSSTSSNTSVDHDSGYELVSSRPQYSNAPYTTKWELELELQALDFDHAFRQEIINDWLQIQARHSHMGNEMLESVVPGARGSYNWGRDGLEEDADPVPMYVEPPAYRRVEEGERPPDYKA